MADHIVLVVCGGSLVFGNHETYLEVSLRSMSINITTDVEHPSFITEKQDFISYNVMSANSFANGD